MCGRVRASKKKQPHFSSPALSLSIRRTRDAPSPANSLTLSHHPHTCTPASRPTRPGGGRRARQGCPSHGRPEGEGGRGGGRRCRRPQRGRQGGHKYGCSAREGRCLGRRENVTHAGTRVCVCVSAASVSHRHRPGREKYKWHFFFACSLSARFSAMPGGTPPPPDDAATTPATAAAMDTGGDYFSDLVPAVPRRTVTTAEVEKEGATPPAPDVSAAAPVAPVVPAPPAATGEDADPATEASTPSPGGSATGGDAAAAAPPAPPRGLPMGPPASAGLAKAVDAALDARLGKLAQGLQRVLDVIAR